MLKIRSLLVSLFLFFSPALALAQAAPAASGSQSGLLSFAPLVLIFIIFYFLLIRPQQKRFKEHQAMVESLKIGNEVFTSSGIFGKVKDIDDKEKLISLEVAEGVVIKILKSSVTQVAESGKKNESEGSGKKNKKSKK